MKKWLKRIRGALGMGLIWAAAWGVVGAIYLSVLVVLGRTPVGTGLAQLVGISVVYAGAGFLSGAIFSTVLGITEGRRRFDEMSIPVFAGAGGTVGGIIVSVLSLSTVLPFTLAGVLGAGAVCLLSGGSAAGSLALARRADDRELLEHGADVADIGLTEEEKRKLLGAGG